MEVSPDHPSSDGGLRRWWVVDFLVPVIILAIGSAVFWSGQLDLDLQAPHFDRANSSWRTDAEPWHLIYVIGVLPAALATAVCIVVLPLSYKLSGLRRFRAPALFFMGAMALGPGLVTNAILKDNWDRPRPRQIEDFGGRYQFEPILRRDSSSRGKSFPCGHAAAVFVLASGFFLLRERRKDRVKAWLFLALAMGLGTATAYARMVQGGHFASDGLWAGGLVFLVTAGLYWIIRARRGALLRDLRSGLDDAGQPTPVWVKVVTTLLVLGFFATFFLATPYQEKFEIRPYKPETSKPLPARVVIEVVSCDVVVRDGESMLWRSECRGHGYAGSNVPDRWVEKLEPEDVIDPSTGQRIRRLGLRQRLSGYFSELNQTGSLEFPYELLRGLRIEVIGGEGSSVVVHLPERAQLPERIDWTIAGDATDITVVLPATETLDERIPDFEIRGLKSAIDVPPRTLRDYQPGIWRYGGIPKLVIKNETSNGRFRVVFADEELPQIGEGRGR